MSRIGVFVCHCGENISRTVDVDKVAVASRQLLGVTHACEYKYMCSDPGQVLLKKAVAEHKLDGVVVAACSPRMHEKTFRKAAEQAGLNPFLCEMANIREHCSWVHEDRDEATAKAIDIVHMLVERVKRNRKEQTPPGWLIDADGKPTTDPNALYGKPEGSILPVGGHKGYSLALMVEVLGGIMARAGHSRENPGPVMNGIFMVVVDIARFVSPQHFRSEVDDLIRYLKTSPVVPGVSEVMYPGEPEARAEAERRQKGIFVEEETWGQIAQAARDLGVAVPAV